MLVLANMPHARATGSPETARATRRGARGGAPRATPRPLDAGTPGPPRTRPDAPLDPTQHRMSAGLRLSYMAGLHCTLACWYPIAVIAPIGCRDTSHVTLTTPPDAATLISVCRKTLTYLVRHGGKRARTRAGLPACPVRRRRRASARGPGGASPRVVCGGVSARPRGAAGPVIRSPNVNR